MAKEIHPYVSRGGMKLAAALQAFELEIGGWVCADLGASTGGFVDCLLQHGAAKVYALDTAYGQLAWKLRQDQRVVVTERTNALHAQALELCKLVTVDLGWTRQDKAIPAALRWLGEGGRIISLIKPHYESTGQALAAQRKGTLSDDQANAIKEQLLETLPTLGVEVLSCIPSPIRGGKGGNLEYLLLLKRQRQTHNSAPIPK